MGNYLILQFKKIMELELKVTAESPRELIKIAAKLSDLDAILKDDIPFMPEDLMSDGSLINSNEEHHTKPTMNELKEALRIFSTIKGQDSALKLLNHFGVTRLSELPEDRRDELMMLTEQI